MMHIRKALRKEIVYACKRFHYAKVTPTYCNAYSVFQDGEWCGCILYSAGANNHIGSPYGLYMGEVVELVRVALNGKQNKTSEAVSMSLRRLHHDNPKVRLVVSYADSGQGHVGTIYQATNWDYVGVSKGQSYIFVNGAARHKRYFASKGGPRQSNGSGRTWIRTHVRSRRTTSTSTCTSLTRSCVSA